MAEEETIAKEGEKTVKAIPIGIKIGSQHTVITTEDSIQIVHTCVKEVTNPVTGKKEYITGNEAAESFGDEAVYMLRGGLPGSEEEADLLGIFLNRIVKEYGLSENSYVTYAVPFTENEFGISLVKKITSQIPVGWAGKEIWNDSFLGAIALSDALDMTERTFLVINLGSSATEIIAVRKGAIILNMVTGAVSGDIVDRWIRNEIQNETRGAVNIDLTTARNYKEKYANLLSWEKVQDTVQLFDKGKYSFRVDECIIRPVNKYLDRLVDYVCTEFLPQLAEINFSVYKQIMDRDFVLVGGMAEIPGLREKLEAKLNENLGASITIKSPENPSTAPARGAYTISRYRVEEA